MTTNHELDRAAAEAMGWTAIADGFYKGELLGRKPGCEEGDYLLPLYSTDPAALPEMLAWLMQHADVEIVAWRDLTVEAATIQSDRHRVDLRRNGATIYEAVARLVVAVAKAKKEQKP